MSLKKYAMLFLVAFGILSLNAKTSNVEIPACQGTRTNPKGDTLTVTSKSLLLNGKPIVPVAGEVHYARVPENEWRDYIRKMKEGGVTIVATYVFWIHHEEKEGVFDFSGRRNIKKFLEICEEEGLWVTLRIGPWSHGECLHGGFPEWLIRKRGWRLRSNHGEYLNRVERWWKRLYEEVDGHLWKQGGCVVSCQLENESAGPWAYLKALKDICRKVGFDVPFYTRTGWPKMRDKAEFGELLPLFGNYADGFWDRNLSAISPGRYLEAFVFSNKRVSSEIATEFLPQSFADSPETAKYPYFTCELGGGMTSSYHRRLRIAPMDTYAMALVKLGSGSNLLGYYMYAGGTNPNRPKEGVFFNERKRSRYTNGNDLPPFSYEFMAPISEFGVRSPSWGLLRPLHKFCANFAKDFAFEDPILINQQTAKRGPFVFHSEYMRSKNEKAIPYIFPENWKTPLGTIKSATAQPVEWKGNKLVMMKIPGIKPHVEFEGKPFDIEFIEFPSCANKPTKTHSASFKRTSGEDYFRIIGVARGGIGIQPIEADWNVASVWEVKLPEGVGDDWILEADYLGDVARVYVDGVPYADDFFKGLPLKCALWRIPKGKVEIKILPWSNSRNIYIQAPMRPKENGAKLNSVRLVPRDLMK
jgi:hypothetical protein